MADIKAPEASTAAIAQAVSKAADELKEAAIQNAVREFEVDLRAAVGRAAIQVSNYYECHMDRGVLNIRVRIEGERS